MARTMQCAKRASSSAKDPVEPPQVHSNPSIVTDQPKIKEENGNSNTSSEDQTESSSVPAPSSNKRKREDDTEEASPTENKRDDATVVAATAANDSLDESGKKTFVQLLSKQAPELLLCHCCKQITPSPIYQCTAAGHFMCFLCRETLQKSLSCPTCEKDDDEKNTFCRNFFAEQLMADCPVPCRYKECPSSDNNAAPLLHKNLGKHLKDCDYRPVKCDRCREICSSWQDLVQHLQDKHQFKVVSFDELPSNGIMVRRYNQAGRSKLVAGKSMYCCWAAKFRPDAPVVMLVCQYCPTKECFFFSIFQLGPDERGRTTTTYRIRTCGPNPYHRHESIVPASSYRLFKGKRIIRTHCFTIFKDDMDSLLCQDGSFEFSFQMI